MRHFLFTCAILFSFNSFASHLLGGNITWECAGNGQYIFTLDLYKDCSASAATFGPTQQISGPNGTMTLNLVSINDMSIACYNNSNGCGSVSPVGTELWTFKSSTPVTLTGTPPPAGWDFTYSSCCHAASVNNGANLNVYLRSRMYNSGTGCYSSPYFISNPSQPITGYNRSISTMAHSPQASDSLYYRFAPSLIATNTPAPYTAGFSYQSPFPNPNTNAANGPVSINGQNGLISVDVQAGTTGLYYYTTVVEQWRGTTLVSEIFRDASTGVLLSTPANNAPIVALDTTLYPQVNRNGNVYTMDALPGDTLSFNIVANDQDFSMSSSSFQQITFSAQGYALDTTWGGTNNFVNKATFTPVGPQTGFVTQLKNEVRFNWIVGNEHINGASARYVFNMRFVDDHCPAVGVSNSILQVNIKPAARIANDTVGVCLGDSITLTGTTASGNYSWTPTNTLIGGNTANPTVYTSTSGFYYLEDPSNPGFKDSVYVRVSPKGFFNLLFTNGQLTVTDSVQTTTRVWYYNSIPFNYTYDTLTPFGLGDYYVVAKSGVCQYTSDTVSITAGMSFSVTAPNIGSYKGTPSMIPGSWGITFQVNQNVNVSWVSIPGISDVYGKTGGYDLNLKVYDNTQTEIFNTDVTIARPIDNVLKVPTNLNLMANQDYTIVVSGDTGYAFSLYDNMALPATPQNVGFTVKALLGGNAGQFPTTPVTYALPISLGIDRTVSLDELSENDWSIYPNPAKEQIHIVGLSGASTIELHDVNGKVVRTIFLKKDQTEVSLTRSDLASGLYFIKVQFENSTSVKKVLFQ